ncbi:hypothetical protein D0T84_19715 [Dysgonomonas sp. 521]|uniref:hypothetical protein n=1 Tax=Dysgonomonas sp. 521 TaxID=2302932 RepID=UPI0013D1DF2C|nr:hypothetical protein [Dysgonomonas sp. 521]NDV97111.1 hypothetical protein [Dysgonomonas sp. 521]
MSEAFEKKKIIDKIVSKMPPYIKPVDYLSTTLDIAKESAYRRLRGEMSFTFDEIVKLSQKLEFSIDELVGNKRLDMIGLSLQMNKDPQQAFLSRLQNFKKYIDNQRNDEESIVMMAFNYLPVIFCLHFEELFRFFYYTWMHRRYKELPKLYYSDIIISDELQLLRVEMDMKIRSIKRITFILDMNVFLSPLREICYFYKLGLINDDELETIKKNFHAMIDFIERIVRTGESTPGTIHYFYLSEFNIDGNSSYILWDGNVVSSFSFHYFNTINISDPEVCDIHKEWLDSLKRYSILITQSDEIIQEEYFDKQRAYIENVKTGNF